MDNEIREFIGGVGAYEPDTSNELYNLFRDLFKRQNYFILNKKFLIVKVSRSERPFWGVGKKYLDLFNELNINYLLVLLISGHEGWVYDKHDVQYHINNGYWKLNVKDNNYKINPPLKDKYSFSSFIQFKKKTEDIL